MLRPRRFRPELNTDPSGEFSIEEEEADIVIIEIEETTAEASLAPLYLNTIATTAVLTCVVTFAASAIEDATGSGAPLGVGEGVCSTRRGRDAFVVRFQAQGGGLERSYVYAAPTPMTVGAGHVALRGLQGQLTRSQLRMRDQAFERAANWLSRLPPMGSGPVSKSFTNRGISGKDARVDIEIISGINFTVQ